MFNAARLAGAVLLLIVIVILGYLGTQQDNLLYRTGFIVACILVVLYARNTIRRK